VAKASEPSVSTTTAAEGVPPEPSSSFDKKYRGTFETHAECVAFVKGVEGVLNYLAEGRT